MEFFLKLSYDNNPQAQAAADKTFSIKNPDVVPKTPTPTVAPAATSAATTSNSKGTATAGSTPAHSNSSPSPTSSTPLSAPADTGYAAERATYEKDLKSDEAVMARYNDAVDHHNSDIAAYNAKYGTHVSDTPHASDTPAPLDKDKPYAQQLKESEAAWNDYTPKLDDYIGRQKKSAPSGDAIADRPGTPLMPTGCPAHISALKKAAPPAAADASATPTTPQAAPTSSGNQASSNTPLKPENKLEPKQLI